VKAAGAPLSRRFQRSSHESRFYRRRSFVACPSMEAAVTTRGPRDGFAEEHGLSAEPRSFRQEIASATTSIRCSEIRTTKRVWLGVSRWLRHGRSARSRSNPLDPQPQQSSLAESWPIAEGLRRLGALPISMPGEPPAPRARASLSSMACRATSSSNRPSARSIATWLASKHTPRLSPAMEGVQVVPRHEPAARLSRRWRPSVFCSLHRP